jgi:hypothetical protein
MLVYPDYYEKFKCIAGDCEDSCCAGWIIDVDDASYYSYQVEPGAFGDRLRESLVVDGDQKYFRVTEDNRCPFLNDKNLCDIITEIGEERICQTCTEHPRYFVVTGDYEQHDISLSCCELGRIFFYDEEPVKYIREELEMDEEDDFDVDPFGDDEDAEMGYLDDDTEEFLFDPVLLDRVLELRDQHIEAMQDRTKPLEERLQTVLGLSLSHPDFDDVYQVLGNLDMDGDKCSIEYRWEKEYEKLKEARKQIETEETRQQFIDACHGKFEIWFEKIATYFIFRYEIDSYFRLSELEKKSGDEKFGETVAIDFEEERRLIRRSIAGIYIMAIQKYLEDQKGEYTVDDMVDSAHLYSKEVEHSDENIEVLKAL